MTPIKIAARKIRSAKKLAIQGWYRACARSEFTWRYVANLKPWLGYRTSRNPLANRHEYLLNELEEKGIVITSVNELMSNTLLFEELEASVLEKEALLADEIRNSREEMSKAQRNKSYVFSLLGSKPVLDPNDIFVRFALQPDLVQLVNSYFGMLTRFRYFNVWHNLPTGQQPRESQLWHRDPEDRYVLKMFVYLTDVDEGSGALSYVPRTHARGSLKTEPASTIVKEGNTFVRRTDDAQMSAMIPREKWITATGKKGVVVLVDTRGYHKGGWARERERIVYTCMFSSQASVYSDVFTRDLQITPSSDKAIAFAVGA
jgi:hypothetical protein